MTAYTVSQVNRYIKSLFTKDFILNRVTVDGEVSNCKYHSSGHIYFTLKDAASTLQCIMFAQQRKGLAFELRDGQRIEAFGQVAVYEKTGTYSLYVRKCELAGAGVLYERFLKLKEELGEMGMFDPIYKKPIPKYVKNLGVVTASTGAAVQDIINISHRRNPYIRLALYPAKVQGEGAAASVANGIRKLDGMGLDAIIVGRGGGSIEDLWAFNEEEVAQAIFDAATPVISAVGHETDYTISDFVADLRASTPSAAAELACFEYAELEQQLDAVKTGLGQAMRRTLSDRKLELRVSSERLKRLAPMEILRHKRELLAGARHRMRQALMIKTDGARHRYSGCKDALYTCMSDRLKETKARLSVTAARLDGDSPLKKMNGGFGYLVSGKGKAIVSVGDVAVGESINAYLRDGRIEAVVSAIGHEKNG